MTLKELHDEWDKDAPIAHEKLDTEARNVPFLHAKWWRIYTREKAIYKKLTFEWDLLYRQKWEWFAGKLDDAERLALKWEPQPLKIIQSNIGIYIAADKDCQLKRAEKEMQEEALRFIEDVIKAINKRSYDIRNAIDFMKFSMGV